VFHEFRVYYYDPEWFEVKKTYTEDNSVISFMDFYKQIEDWCSKSATARWNLTIGWAMDFTKLPVKGPRYLVIYFENQLDAAKLMILF